LQCGFSNCFLLEWNIGSRECRKVDLYGLVLGASVPSFIDYHSQLCTDAFLGFHFHFQEHAMRSFEMVSFDEATQYCGVTSASSFILRSHHATQDSFTIQDVTTLPELFKWQAQRRCDATLFSFRISPDASLTTVSYADAYETSSQLANQ
jgi:hypothetical protein